MATDSETTLTSEEAQSFLLLHIEIKYLSKEGKAKLEEQIKMKNENI